MNILEKTLEVYKLLKVKLKSLNKNDFFKPMFDMLCQYDKENMGMIKSVKDLSSCCLTDHHKLINKTKWISKDLGCNLIELRIKRVTTTGIEWYAVYLYKDELRIMEYWKEDS